MTQLAMPLQPDPAALAAFRGALPDAPLAMPGQPLEPAVAGWLARLTMPLRLLRLPMSRGI